MKTIDKSNSPSTAPQSTDLTGPSRGQDIAQHRTRWVRRTAGGLATAIALSASIPSYAGWFDDKISHPLGGIVVHHLDNVAQVATFGEVGRQRDRERAEAAEREAQIKADAARQQKADRINSAKAEIVTLTQIGTNLSANKKVADDAWSIHEKIIATAEAELAVRFRAAADEERAADATRKARDELAGLSSALVSLDQLDHRLNDDARPNDVGRAENANALEVAQQVLRTADLDAASNELYLERAVRSMKTDDLKDLIEASIKARSFLSGLRANLEDEARSYADQLSEKQKELATLQA